MPGRSSTFRSRTLVAVLAAALSGVRPAAGVDVVRRPDADAVLVAVRVGRSVRAEAVAVYPGGGRALLAPLRAITSLLGFRIDVDPAAARAEGYFLREDRKFVFDGATGRAVVEGRSTPVDAALWEAHPDDLYVDTSLLSRWFPIDATFDFAALELDIHPREPLPDDERNRRAKESQVSAPAPRSHPEYPLLPLPYRPFSLPFLDETLGFRLSRPEAAPSSWDLTHSTYLTGDLLWQEMHLYAFGTQHDPTADVRLSLGRRDPRGGLLGPLRATEYAAGEVLFPGDPLLSYPGAGAGVLLGNFPLSRSGQIARETFRGDLPPGWDVELYRNGVLIGYQQSRADGAYEFAEVDLDFGWNLFRLVFYGPRGERREETRSYSIEDAMVPAGRTFWRLVGNRPRSAGKRGLLEAETGLSRWLTAAAALSTVRIDGRQESYARAGLRASGNAFFVTADVAGRRAGGWLADVSARTVVGDLRIALEQAWLSGGFVSEVFLPLPAPVGARSSARVSGVVPALGPLPAIPFEVFGQHDTLASGGRTDRLGARLSMSAGRFFISNRWESDRISAGGSTSETGFGDFLVSRYFGRAALRGEALYRTSPSRALENLAVVAELFGGNGLVTSAGVNRYVGSGDTHFLAGVEKGVGAYGFGVRTDWSQRVGLSLLATISISIAPDPRGGTWHAQARPLAGAGTISPRAFLDADGNGRFDAGETPLEGESFLLAGVRQAARTDRTGVAFLPGVPDGEETELALDRARLDEAGLLAETDGYRFVGRAGRGSAAEFPVVASGEVTGTVRILDAGESREAAGLTVQLIDRSGSVSASAASAFDGFFDLAGLRPGAYRLRIDPDQAARLGRALRAEVEITLSPAGTVRDGADLLLVPRPAVASGAASGAGTVSSPSADATTAAPAAAPSPSEPIRRVAPPSRWTIQLETVCRTPSIETARRLSASLPLRLRPAATAGGGCVRVLFGSYGTREEAERALSAVPALFRERGNAPFAAPDPE